MKQFVFSSLFLIFCNSIYSQNLDYILLKRMNEGEHVQWDKAMRLTSNSVYLTAPLSVGFIWVNGKTSQNEVMLRNSYKSIVTIGFSSLLTMGLKYIVQRERPYVKYPNDIIQRTKSGPFSFPSGHTSLAFATATAITLSSRNVYIAIPSYLYAALVGYSRMRLGVHFPSDVLGGMVIGIGSGLLTWQLDRMLNGK